MKLANFLETRQDLFVLRLEVFWLRSVSGSSHRISLDLSSWSLGSVSCVDVGKVVVQGSLVGLMCLWYLVLMSGVLDSNIIAIGFDMSSCYPVSTRLKALVFLLWHVLSSYTRGVPLTPSLALALKGALASGLEGALASTLVVT